MASKNPVLTQSIRRLARERGFTLTVLLTLALCVGANVSMYAVIDAVLVRSLPFQNSERLVTLRNAYPGAGVERSGASLTNYYARRGNIGAFDSMSIVQGGSAIIGKSGSPERVPRDRVSPEFFSTLGVPLALGRAFTDDDMVYANAQRLIITHEFWQRRFNGDPNVLGRTVVADGLDNEVVGVLPPDFRYLDSKAQFFIPLASDLEDRGPRRRHSNNVQMIARLAPGATLLEAQQQMDAFNDAQWETDPFATVAQEAGFRTDVLGLREDAVRDVRSILLVLQAGAFALLAIGCVNLVNLLLIRAKGREKESAIRRSLGAGHRHVARETLAETVALAVIGGGLGLAVGAIGIRLLATLGANQLPLGASIAFDDRVAVVSLLGSFFVGVALAFPIVVFNSRRDLAPTLQSESRSGTVSRAAQSARHAFIVAQVALAFALLAGAGLLGLSLKKVLDASPGFQTEEVLTAKLTLPWKTYPEAAPRQAFMENLLNELRNLPGVTMAGLGDGLPFGGGISDNATTVEGFERAPGESIRTHYTSFAMGEYWQTLGIPLLEGRNLSDADMRTEEQVCVVDEAFATRYWPDESALGRRIASDVTVTEENAMTIVGVVGTVKQNDLADTDPLGAVYVPYNQRATTSFSIAIRTAMAPTALAPALEKLVLRLDPELPVDDIKVMQERVDDSLLIRRSPAILATIFATVALLLAAIGTYGVLAYAVAQRRREIGVRLALGAHARTVVHQFLGLGARLLLMGLALGAVGAWLAGAAMRSALVDVAPFHLGVMILTALIMAAVVLLATLVPSRRAARVSPLEAMSEH